MTDPRRRIPSVDALLESAAFEALLRRVSRDRVGSVLRDVVARVRSGLAEGGPDADRIADPGWYADAVTRSIEQLASPPLRPVINATGVVLHTNLGRAPLSETARRAMREAAGYTAVEYDLEHGVRGSRHDHCVGLLRELTGAEDALVVNNNAAAVVLSLNTLALGREAIISRGELVEIGGSFRVPEIMERSGARMREVGATNRTHASDYAEAIGSDTGVLLKVHRSNFRVEGFTAEVPVRDLAELARGGAVPLLHDLGSGAFLDMETLGLPHEPTPRESLAAGADLVTMSGDKLLGGPQAGIAAGRADLIQAMRANPLCRALRPDKLTLAALAATLVLYLEPERAIRDVPVLRMIATSPAELAERAATLVARFAELGIPAETVPSKAAVGGGAYPGVELPGVAVAVAPRGGSIDALAGGMRSSHPAVVGRIREDRLLLDVRTIDPSELDAVVRVVHEVMNDG